MNTWLLVDHDNQAFTLPNNGHIRTKSITDRNGSLLTIIEISNGSLLFTVIPERGMDIGELYLGSQKMSWERNEHYLMHPSHVNLHASNGTGWMNGFYGAVAAIGPELFGTPGEGFTLHGSGSYSASLPESIQVTWDDHSIIIEGLVSVKDRDDNLLFEKFIQIRTEWGSPLLLREEKVTNGSSEVQVLDDGYHIQLSGAFMHQGGRYVLPVQQHELLIRDSAIGENDPFHIPPIEDGPYPMRCYQYVPRKIERLLSLDKIAPHISRLNVSRGLTCEMIVNSDYTYAGYVIRPLVDFPRSLIAKQIDDSFMFAIEPCRTRPNRMSQKITDGEALYIQVGETVSSSCIIGFSNTTAEIQHLESLILSAADRA